MTLEKETLWLRAWERGARNHGWYIVQRSYLADEGTAEAYGFYRYVMEKDGKQRDVQIGMLMMEEFAPSESVLYSGLDPEFTDILEDPNPAWEPVKESKAKYDRRGI